MHLYNKQMNPYIEIKKLDVKRDYNIDILKIILAILIVTNHCIGHGLKEYAPNIYTQNKNILGSLVVIANPAVNVFFIISGFFRIKRTLKSAVSLFQPMFFIS